MSYYQPDNWVIFKLSDKDPHYRVLAGWSGSYLHGDSWRINSGITKVEKGSTTWKFYGETGSIYECGFHNYGLRFNNSHIWESIKESYGKDVEIMPEDTNWLSIVDYVYPGGDCQE